MNLKRCYATLEIHENANAAEIRQAYRDLIAVWHPDRHQKNPRLQEKATEKLKEINLAYDALMAHRQVGHDGATVGRHTSEKRTHTHTRPHAKQPVKPGTKKHPFITWLVLMVAVGITALAIYSRWPDMIAGLLPEKGQQGGMAAEESAVYSWTTVQHDVKRIAELQRALKLMGYDSGPADGKMGQKTTRAAQQFAADFRVNRDSHFVENLLAESARQASIARIHADWPGMVNSRNFNHWIENQTITAPEICRKVVVSGSAAQVVKLVYGYTFHQDQPAPKKLPASGIMHKQFYQGTAPLKIKTRGEDRHFFIKLIALPEKKEVVSIFIRGGDMLKIRMPLGIYALKYAVGETWYGTRWLFGDDTVYSRLDQKIEFKFTENEISGYSIDLYLKPVVLSKASQDYAFDF
ncbi:MAG: DnaJ domain-containing protein [Deltaproteobacteria bacterium]|nr:DnaJ domain-containing protein [Deltaproteobacteria bacterium]